jgi:hypothetical protein
VLVPDTEAHALARAGDFLYFATDTTIQRVPTGGGPATVLVSGFVRFKNAPAVIALDDTSIYWADYQHNIRSAPLPR